MKTGIKLKVAPGKYLVIADETRHILLWARHEGAPNCVLLFTTYEKASHFALTVPFCPERGSFLEMTLQEIADQVSEASGYLVDPLEPEDFKNSLPLPARRTTR